MLLTMLISLLYQVHPSRELVASGQKAGRHRKAQPHVRIWSTETLLTLYVFGMTEFQMGVSALAFSQLVKIINSRLSQEQFFTHFIIHIFPNFTERW